MARMVAGMGEGLGVRRGGWEECQAGLAARQGRHLYSIHTLPLLSLPHAHTPPTSLPQTMTRLLALLALLVSRPGGWCP